MGRYVFDATWYSKKVPTDAVTFIKSAAFINFKTTDCGACQNRSA